jgi:hypothetical protein
MQDRTEWGAFDAARSPGSQIAELARDIIAGRIRPSGYKGVSNLSFNRSNDLGKTLRLEGRDQVTTAKPFEISSGISLILTTYTVVSSCCRLAQLVST